MQQQTEEPAQAETAAKDYGNTNCSICLDQILDPKLLKCGHSFCLECIAHWRDLKKLDAACPTCRRGCPGHDALLDEAAKLLTRDRRISGTVPAKAETELLNRVLSLCRQALETQPGLAGGQSYVNMHMYGLAVPEMN